MHLRAGPRCVGAPVRPSILAFGASFDKRVPSQQPRYIVNGVSPRGDKQTGGTIAVVAVDQVELEPRSLHHVWSRRMRRRPSSRGDQLFADALEVDAPVVGGIVPVSGTSRPVRATTWPGEPTQIATYGALRAPTTASATVGATASGWTAAASRRPRRESTEYGSWRSPGLLLEWLCRPARMLCGPWRRNSPRPAAR